MKRKEFENIAKPNDTIVWFDDPGKKHVALFLGYAKCPYMGMDSKSPKLSGESCKECLGYEA